MMVQFQLIHIMMGESLMVFTIMVEYQLNQWNILQMIICDIICVMLIGYGSAVQTAFITLLIDVFISLVCLHICYIIPCADDIMLIIRMMAIMIIDSIMHHYGMFNGFIHIDKFMKNNKNDDFSDYSTNYKSKQHCWNTKQPFATMLTFLSVRFSFSTLMAYPWHRQKFQSWLIKYTFMHFSKLQP